MRYGRFAAAVCSGLLLCQPAVCIMQAQAYDAPSGIELSLGSAEVERASLAENDLVEIPIYIRNNPGFTSLNMIITLDEGLRFDDEIDASVTAEGIEGVNLYRCDDSGRVLSACFEVPRRHRFTDDGELGKLRIRVDGNISDGWYGASFAESGGNFRMKIFTYNDMDAEFGAECFSLLEGGGITVGNAAAPVSVQEERPADNGDTHRSQPVQGGESYDSGSPQEEADRTVTSAAEPAATTTSAVSASAAAQSVTTTSSAAVSSTTTAETTVKTSASTEASSTTNAIPGETETRKRGGLPFPVIAAAVIAAAAAVGLVSRKRR